MEVLLDFERVESVKRCAYGNIDLCFKAVAAEGCRLSTLWCWSSAGKVCKFRLLHIDAPDTKNVTRKKA